MTATVACGFVLPLFTSFEWNARTLLQERVAVRAGMNSAWRRCLLPALEIFAFLLTEVPEHHGLGSRPASATHCRTSMSVGKTASSAGIRRALFGPGIGTTNSPRGVNARTRVYR